MNYRYMRVVVFFDLPVLTAHERKEYRAFRKYLIKSGFLMMQESVYCKLVPNSNTADILAENVRRNSPSEGLVSCLRALLIQIGVKQMTKEFVQGAGLRALLIQIGVKPCIITTTTKKRLRALLIQIGVKRRESNGLDLQSLRALLIQIGVKRQPKHM